ncbi:hypothetical protein ABZP36_026936 [Zizania latifolia]
MVDAPAAASHSSPDEEDDAGLDSEDSKSEHGVAPQDPPVPCSDVSVPPPGSSAPAASVPTGGGAIPQATPAGAGTGTGTEDSRRLFQRLWTDEEELLILRGFLDFTTRRGTTFASHQYDTAPFYEEIRRRLSCDFTKNQLIEKLRRLKKKYRVCASRMAAQSGAFAFKSAHEGAPSTTSRATSGHPPSSATAPAEATPRMRTTSTPPLQQPRRRPLPRRCPVRWRMVSTRLCPQPRPRQGAGEGGVSGAGRRKSWRPRHCLR